MGSSGLITKEKPRVEDTSLTKLFEEQCPIYMSYGMTYDEFWYGDAYRAKFYREAHEIQTKNKDEELWMQGVYIYDALCRVSPILHAFSKSGTKPLPYVEKPYMSSLDKNKKTEEEKEQEAKNERLRARIQFDNWFRATKKHFKQ